MKVWRYYILIYLRFLFWSSWSRSWFYRKFRGAGRINFWWYYIWMYWSPRFLIYDQRHIISGFWHRIQIPVFAICCTMDISWAVIWLRLCFSFIFAHSPIPGIFWKNAGGCRFWLRRRIPWSVCCCVPMYSFTMCFTLMKIWFIPEVLCSMDCMDAHLYIL